MTMKDYIELQEDAAKSKAEFTNFCILKMCEMMESGADAEEFRKRNKAEFTRVKLAMESSEMDFFNCLSVECELTSYEEDDVDQEL